MWKKWNPKSWDCNGDAILCDHSNSTVNVYNSSDRKWQILRKFTC